MISLTNQHSQGSVAVRSIEFTQNHVMTCNDRVKFTVKCHPTCSLRIGLLIMIFLTANCIQVHDSIWVCLKIGYIPNYSHLKTG